MTGIAIYFKAVFTGSDIIPDDIDSRYVNVTIYDSNGIEIWSKERTMSEGTLEERIEPQENGKFLSGDWNVVIKALGWGLAVTENAELQDSFLVTITVTRTCLEFPPDYGECITL